MGVCQRMKLAPPALKKAPSPKDPFPSIPQVRLKKESSPLPSLSLLTKLFKAELFSWIGGQGTTWTISKLTQLQKNHSAQNSTLLRNF